MSRVLTPGPLSEAAFAAFGSVIQSSDDGFSSVFQQPDAAGWQIGLNRVGESDVPDLHYHPDTWECFAPLDPHLILVVAPVSAELRPELIEAFALDAPVCVRPGVWHRLVCTGNAPAVAFIAENARVTGVVARLDTPLRVTVGGSASVG